MPGSLVHNGSALPPGASGRPQGKLSLTVDDLSLDIGSRDALRVRLKWWGQQEYGALLTPGTTATYQVTCGETGLARYLRAAAFIDAVIISSYGAVGCGLISTQGLLEQRPATFKASISARDDSRRVIGSLSGRVLLHYFDTGAGSAASDFFQRILAAARREESTLPMELDVAFALERWSGGALSGPEKEYSLAMLGGARPGARARPPELLGALEGCVAAEQWASDWLEGAASGIEDGVRELALDWLLSLGSPMKAVTAICITQMARQLVACAPDASLKHLRLLLAAVRLDQGDALTVGGAVEVCTLLAGLDSSQEEPSPSGHESLSPRDAPGVLGSTEPLADADERSTEPPEPRPASSLPAPTAVSVQPQQHSIEPWEAQGGFWSAAAPPQQIAPLHQLQSSSLDGHSFSHPPTFGHQAFLGHSAHMPGNVSSWAYTAVAPIGFPEFSQGQPAIGYPTAAAEAWRPASAFEWTQLARRPSQALGGQAEGRQQVVVAPSGWRDDVGGRDREDLQALIAAAEELHRDLGHALYAHGQLRTPPAEGAARKEKPCLPAFTNGLSGRGLSSGADSSADKENMVEEGAPSDSAVSRSIGRRSQHLPHSAIPNTLQDRQQRDEPAAEIQPDLPRQLDGPESPGSEEPAVAGQGEQDGSRFPHRQQALLSAPELGSSEQKTAPVGREGGPDVLHTISLKIASLEVPEAGTGPKSLRPSHLWLVYKFPRESEALLTRPLPVLEHVELGVRTEHQALLPGGKKLGGPHAPGTLNFELWQSGGAAASAVGRIPLTVLASLPFPPKSGEETETTASYSCSLPLQPECSTAGQGWQDPPVLRLQLAYTVLEAPEESAVASCSIRGASGGGLDECMLGGRAPSQQMPLQVTVIRACGLEAAVKEAVSWLGAGSGKLRHHNVPHVVVRLAWPPCAQLDSMRSEGTGVAVHSACPEFRHSERCCINLAAEDAGSKLQEEVSVEIWHIPASVQASAAALEGCTSERCQEVFLGRAPLRLESLAHSQESERWLPLKSRRGRVVGGVQVRVLVGDESVPAWPFASMLPRSLNAQRLDVQEIPEALGCEEAAVRLHILECWVPLQEQYRRGVTRAAAAYQLAGRLLGSLACFCMEGRAEESRGKRNREGNAKGCCIAFNTSETFSVRQGSAQLLMHQPLQLVLLETGAKPSSKQQCTRAVGYAGIPLNATDRQGGSAVQEAPLFCPKSGRLGCISYSIEVEARPNSNSADPIKWQPHLEALPDASSSRGGKTQQFAAANQAAAQSPAGGGQSVVRTQDEPPALPSGPAADSAGSPAKESLEASSAGASNLAAAAREEASGPWLRVESALHLSLGRLTDGPRLSASSNASGSSGLVAVAAEAGGWSMRTPSVAAVPGIGSAVWDHDACLPVESLPETLPLEVWVVQPGSGRPDELLGTAKVNLAALQRLGELRGWYNILGNRGVSVGQLKVRVRAASQPGNISAASAPRPAPLDADSTVDLRSALHSNLRDLDGIMSRLGSTAAPSGRADSSPANKADEEQVPLSAARAELATDMTAESPHAATSPSASAASAGTRACDESAGEKLRLEEGSLEGTPDWEEISTEIARLDLSGLLQGLDQGSGSFLDVDFDLNVLPANSWQLPPASSIMDLGAAGPAESSAGATGELRTCSDDEGVMVDLSCMVPSSKSSSGSDSPVLLPSSTALVETAASGVQAKAFDGEALFIGDGADDWMFTLCREQTAESSAARLEDAASEQQGEQAASLEVLQSARSRGSDAAADSLSQQPVRDGSDAADSLGGQEGASMEGSGGAGGGPVTLQHEALSTSPQLGEAADGLTNSEFAGVPAGSEASAKNSVEAGIGELAVPLHPLLEVPHPSRVSSPLTLVPLRDGNESGSGHPLLEFDPFAQPLPVEAASSLRPSDSPGWAIRTFAPPDFAAELECPPSPASLARECQRLRSARLFSETPMGHLEDAGMPLTQLGKLHSLPEVDEHHLSSDEAALQEQPPPTTCTTSPFDDGRPALAASPGSSDSEDGREAAQMFVPLAGPSSSAPILVSRIPIQHLETPFDASLASSEETWDNPLLRPLHIVPETLRAGDSSTSQQSHGDDTHVARRAFSAPPAAANPPLRAEVDRAAAEEQSPGETAWPSAPPAEDFQQVPSGKPIGVLDAAGSRHLTRPHTTPAPHVTSVPHPRQRLAVSNQRPAPRRQAFEREAARLAEGLEEDGHL